MPSGRNDPDTDKLWSRLAASFDPDRETKPIDADRAMFFAQRRLDAVAPGEWDCTFDPLPPRFSHNVTGEVSTKCRVQIMGVIREACGTGATYIIAHRDAFLAACRMFGIPCDPAAYTNDAPTFDVPPVTLGTDDAPCADLAGMNFITNRERGAR